MSDAGDRFPFSAVVGMESASLALILAAVDPRIGGVLLRGEKGSAKSTLARGLAGLLPAGAPFVELPVGATEDRLVGSLDVGAAVGEGRAVLRPGLLAAAHGGVLYVDEVNLLPDHLVDVLLDAAAGGVHRVERDGLSHEHPARFVLVGSMNPEEGELRPQLLDRFGFSVEVRAPADPHLRAEVVARRLAFEGGVPTPGDQDGVLASRLAEARPARLPSAVIHFAARLAVCAGAEGLRADLVLCRGAAAMAGWEGREEATIDDVELVAPLALAHRRRRRPFDPPTFPPDELEEAIDRARSEGPGEADPAGADSGLPSATSEPAESSSPSGNAGFQNPIGTRGRWGDLAGAALAARAAPLTLAAPGMVSAGPVIGPHVRGPLVGAGLPPPGGPGTLAVAATLRAGLGRRALQGGGAVLDEADLREGLRRREPNRCLVLVLDTSGSMGARARVEAAAGAVLALLAGAYRRRHRVALITFRGVGAEVVLPPTASVEVARARLDDLSTGGATPLAEGLNAALEVARRAALAGDDPLVVVISDGRATAGERALERGLEAAGEIASAGVSSLVLDAEVVTGEPGLTGLGLARRLAEALGAPCVSLGELSADSLESAIRQAAAQA
ncbi:MAG: VWA domain-containing protein [Acidimicrobiia bacterium]